MSMEDRGIKDYTVDLEILFVRLLISDGEMFVRCLNILKPIYFESSDCAEVIKFIMKYTAEHSTLPSIDVINTLCKTKFKLFTQAECKHEEKWFLKEFETFCRHRALEREIYGSMKLLEEKRYGEVEANIKQAVQIGLVKDLGINYFSEPAERIRSVLQKNDMIPTGWKDIDGKLYGGTERGTISIFAGQSGTGKSLFLQNWALNLAMQGLNVIYITLELSEKLTAMRLDAMISGYGTKEVARNPEDAGLRVGAFSKKYKGTLQLKQMPNGVTANDIRAYIKEYEIQTNIPVDAVMVDYLDLLMPMSKQISPSDLFIKDKYVTEELRNLAIDLDVVMGTASQLNRKSHEEIEFDHSHIAGGISKINTADNVIAIFTTMTMRENGRYQVQLLKTRSSAGTGVKIDLKYNLATMRISDLEEGDQSASQSVTSSIVDKLKKKSVIKEPKDNVEKTGDSLVDTTRLRELMRDQ